MIARQRFNLNRANRLAKHKPADKTFAEDPLKIAGFEETLVGLTREFTEGVEGIVGQRIEPLHAAEESMLAAVAALDHGQNERAPGHMGDALRHLIEARDTLRVTIGQDAAAAAGDAQLRPHASPEDPQAEERRGRGRGDRRGNRRTRPGRRLRLRDPGRPHDGATGGRGEEGEEAETEEEMREEEEPAKRRRSEKSEDRKAERPKGSGAGQGKGQAGEKGEPDDEDGGEPRKTSAARPWSGRSRSPIRPASWKRS